MLTMANDWPRRRAAAAAPRPRRGSSLQGAGRQEAERKGLFGNRQTNAHLLRPLFGQQKARTDCDSVRRRCCPLSWEVQARARTWFE